MYFYLRQQIENIFVYEVCMRKRMYNCIVYVNGVGKVWIMGFSLKCYIQLVLFKIFVVCYQLSNI